MKKLLHERLRDWEYSNETAITVLTGKEAEEFAGEIEKYYIPRPRYEDGEPVEYESETEYGTVLGFITYLGGFDYKSVGLLTLENDIVIIPKRELLKRQTEVLDADGVEIKVGDTVYISSTGKVFVVEGIEKQKKHPICMMTPDRADHGTYADPQDLTHERPVFDANGERICNGDTVWCIDTAQRIEVQDINPEHVTQVKGVGTKSHGWYCAETLTHREPDNYEKLRDDMNQRAGNCNIDDVKAWADRLTALIERDA